MEIWKDVKGYEGLYQVSNFGRVKSLDRLIVGKNRKIFFKGKFIKQFVGDNGYKKVTLSKDGKVVSKDVHVLIWKAFNGAIPQGMQVNHIDENKTNNTLSNLNLLSPKDNINWGTAIERMKKNKSKTTYQYTLDDVLVAVYDSTKQAAITNNFDQSTISACARGEKSFNTYKGFKWSYKPIEKDLEDIATT